MKNILELFTNDILLMALCAWATAQVGKLLLNLVIEHKFSIERLFGDGGMPSAHSATVTALAMGCGWTMGFGSAVFAVAFVFALVVMHDACGVRLEAGKQAATIKKLAEALESLMHERDYNVRTEKLKVLVGHTPLQVFFGAILGITVATVYILLFIL